MSDFIQVKINSKDDIQLAGLLYEPHTNETQAPSLVICQGLSGDKYKVLPDIAEYFQSRGYLVLIFDYQGCGESEGITTELFPQKRIEDALAAISFLSSHRLFDKHNFFIYGISLGASLAPAVANLSKFKANAVAVCSGLVNGADILRCLRTQEDWLEFQRLISNHKSSNLTPVNEVFPLPQAFWDKYNALSNKNQSETVADRVPSSTPCFSNASVQAIIAYSLTDYLKKLTSPILVMHGSQDNICAVEDARNCYEHITAKAQLHIFNDYDHIDLDKDPGLHTQISMALDWFEQHRT